MFDTKDRIAMILNPEKESKWKFPDWVMSDTFTTVFFTSLVCIMMVIVFACAIYAEVTVIQEGVITELKYEPSRTYPVMLPVTTTDSNGNMSTGTVQVMRHDDEDWIVKVELWDEEDQKMRRNSFYITEEVFDSLSVGEYFIFDSELGLDNDPNYDERVD